MLRVGLLLAASIAAFAVTQFNIKCSRNPITSTEEGDSSFQQEQNEAKQEEEEVKSIRTNRSDCLDFNILVQAKKWENVTDIELFKNLVKEMEQRRMTLEAKLLELYGLKEKASGFVQLQKQLKAKSAQVKMLRGTVNTLGAERERLHEEIRHNLLAEKQLEVAKQKITEMKAKMRVDAVQVKRQLTMVREQVLGFEFDIPIRDKVEKRLRAIKDVELEVVEMKRENKELQFEKRELAIKLAAAQANATALSHMTQSRMISKMEDEKNGLRHANGNLLEQIDKLQKNRFSIVEEVVYQRWLNACLRFEVQCHQIPSGRVLIFETLEETQKPIQDPNSESVSSRTSSTKSNEITSTTSTSSSSSSSLKNVHKKPSLANKLKRWGRNKDDSNANTTPSQSSRSAQRKKDEVPTISRIRRVSFSDSIKPIALAFGDISKSGEDVLSDEQRSTKTFKDDPDKNTSHKPKSFRLNPTEIESHSSSIQRKQEIENDKDEDQMISKIGSAHREDLSSGIERSSSQMMHLIAVFIFLLFYCYFTMPYLFRFGYSHCRLLHF